MSADLSTLFDVGGIVGAIAAGVLSDYSGMSALTCAVMFGLAFPAVSPIFSLSNGSNGKFSVRCGTKRTNNTDNKR